MCVGVSRTRQNVRLCHVRRGVRSSLFSFPLWISTDHSSLSLSSLAKAPISSTALPWVLSLDCVLFLPYCFSCCCTWRHLILLLRCLHKFLFPVVLSFLWLLLLFIFSSSSSVIFLRLPSPSWTEGMIHFLQMSGASWTRSFPGPLLFHLSSTRQLLSGGLSSDVERSAGYLQEGNGDSCRLSVRR